MSQELKSREGQRVPEVVFRTRKDSQWVNLSTADVFAGKKVLLFALPGAYTPTCSSTHLPRYQELAGLFKEQGVSTIACLSVNDGFVMEAWGKDQEADGILMLPDGNGDFTRGMGMLVDKAELGFGPRSWRYSMLVDDGLIVKQFIEPQKPGDPFEVSDADTMLKFLAPKAKEAPRAFMFAKEGCGHCARARGLLKDRGYQVDEIFVGRGAGKVTISALRAATGKITAPQVYIGGQHIGGADDLTKWFESR